MGAIVQSHNVKAQSLWNSPGGRYDLISRTIADAIEHAIERATPKPGERVLDLATGTGWGSRVIAQRFPGVIVTGADIADEMLVYARSAAATQQLAVDYVHADAEKLPFEDGSFDVVVSTFGVMFVANPEIAASEIKRVLKPGGRLSLATWKPDSNLFLMFMEMKKFMSAPVPAPASPPPSPFAWGERARVAELFGDAFDLGFEDGTNWFRYASGEDAWRLWVEHYGPMKTLAASLDDARRSELQRAIVAWHETFATELGYALPRTYLVTRGVRRAV